MIDINEPESAFALRMVREAGCMAQRVQQGMAMMGQTKADLSPVTVGDYAIQALVARGLAAAFPDDTLVGEETSEDLRSEPGAEMLDVVTRFVGPAVAGATGNDVCDWIDLGSSPAVGRFWTLDPIDGTKGYLRGGQYAVALALIEDGQVLLGALGCPNLNTACQPDEGGAGAVLIARRGGGAWVASMQDYAVPLSPLHVSDCADPAHVRMLRSFESGHTNVDQIDAIASRLNLGAEPVLMDSQAKYAVLAAGGAELLLRLLSPDRPDYREKIWDQAAGAILLEEAGGCITDLQGRPLDFGHGRKLAQNTGVFASNGPLHEAGLAAISAVVGCCPGGGCCQ